MSRRFSIWLLLLYVIVASASDRCFPPDTAYPRILGGLTGETIYHTLAVQEVTGKIAAGGHSAAFDLTDFNAKRGIIALFDPDGSYIWNSFVYTSFELEFRAVIFNDAKGEVVYAAGNVVGTMARIFRINVLTGLYVKGYSAPAELYFMHGTIRIKNDYLYITMQRADSRACLLGFHLRDNDVISNAYFLRRSTEVNSYFSSIDLFGTLLIVSGTINFSGRTYLTLFTFDSTNGAMLFNQGLDQPQDSTAFLSQDAFFAYVGTDAYRYTTGVRGSEVLFLSNVFDQASVRTRTWAYVYDFNDGQAKQVGLYAQITDVNKLYAYVWTTTNSNFFVVTVTFSSAIGGTITKKLLSAMSNSGNILKAAVFVSTSTSYYLAQVVAVKGQDEVPIALAQTCAGLMNSDYEQSCFNIEEDTTTDSIGVVSITWGALSDSFPYITGYQFNNHNSGVQVNHTSTQIIPSSWCPSLPGLILPDQDDLAYTILSGPETYILKNFSTDRTCSDITFTYSLIYPATPLGLPAPFSYNAATNSLNVDSSSLLEANIYPFELTAVCDQDNSLTGTVSFTVEINACSIGTITATQYGDYDYYLGDVVTLDFTPKFTLSMPQCPVTFAAFSDSAYTTVLDSAIFTFDSAALTLAVSTSNLVLHGTFSDIYIRALVNANNPGSIVHSKARIIHSKCKLTVVNIPSISDIYYDLGQGLLKIQYQQWVSSFSADCGAFTIDAFYQSNDTQLQSSDIQAIRHIRSNRTISVQSTSAGHIGFYTIVLVGQAGPHPVFRIATFNINIDYGCQITPSSLASQTYTVNQQPALIITFAQFTTQYCIPSTVIYTAEMNSQVLPSWVIFDSNQRTLTVQANSNDQKGIKTIKISGYILGSNTGRSYIADMAFNLTIRPQNTGPPIMDKIPSLIIKAGVLSSLDIPSIEDPDEDNYTVKVSFDGISRSFSRFYHGKFQFLPIDQHLGTYSITITIIDDNLVPLKSIYKFDVTVVESESNGNGTDNEPIFEGIQIPEEPGANATLIERDRYNQNKTKYKDFAMQIVSISSTGLVTVRFTDDIIVPKINCTQVFNNTDLRLTILPSIQSELTQLGFKWQCESISQRTLQLQLQFDNYLAVSADVRNLT